MLTSDSSYHIWKCKLDGEISNLVLTNKLEAKDKDDYLLNLLPSRVSDDILSECTKFGIGTTTAKTLLLEIEKVWKGKQRVSLQTLIQNPITTRDDVERMVLTMRKLVMLGFLPEAVVSTCIEAIPDLVIRNQLLLSTNTSDVDDFITNLRKVQWCTIQADPTCAGITMQCKECKKRHSGKCWKLLKCFRCLQVGHIQRFCPKARLN